MAFPLSYFLTRKRTEPDWIIPNILKRNNTAFIIGEPKRACKSWLMLNLGWDLAEGHPLWGVRHSKEGFMFTPPRPMRTIYFTQEDTEDDIQDRFDLLYKNGKRVPNDNLLIVPRNLQMSFDNATSFGLLRDQIIEVVKGFGPVDLLMFDPFRRMHSKDENSSESMVGIWKVLDVIYKEYNCSGLISHHIVKPPQDKSKYDPTSPFTARGSGDIYGAADALINVVPRPKKGRHTRLRALNLHFTTKRSRPLNPLGLTVSFETGLVTFDGYWNGKGIVLSEPEVVDEGTEDSTAKPIIWR